MRFFFCVNNVSFQDFLRLSFVSYRKSHGAERTHGLPHQTCYEINYSAPSRFCASIDYLSPQQFEIQFYEQQDLNQINSVKQSTKT